MSNKLYEFHTQVTWLTMKDGVRLSATIYQPRPVKEDEKFPVLLELLPYRKDDSFYIRDYPLYSYFASRGYITVKVDVRGTGSSEGQLPGEEYSDQEIDDAVELVDQLSRLTGANGKVAMWGISWGGFNAIQVAMRRPPALKAIIAIHASDDLFHDDIHYIDGALHVNWYALEIDHENGLPRSPDYRLDDDFFEQRFNAKPWLIKYLNHQRDGEFWRRKSLRWQYDRIDIPVYLIGGLLDGYRDTVPRMLANLSSPVKAEIGPWNHDFPDTGLPGPNYEWRKNAVKFFDRWLKGARNNVMKKPFMVFVRDGHKPDRMLRQTPGHWRYEDWPIKRMRLKKLYPSKRGCLEDAPPEKSASHFLAYVASSGVAAGKWWGEPTGDMRLDDAYALVYDSAVLKKKVEIIGFPRVRLSVSADAPLAHWVARLEDIAPDGSVSLVTGAVLNGSQRRDRTNPSALTPGKVYDLSFDLHFTTWTFKPGHRIRLAVSNAQFPMIWPTPHGMTTTLHLGAGTSLVLPVIPAGRRAALPRLASPEPREKRDDASYGPDCPRLEEHKIVYDQARQSVLVVDRNCHKYTIGERKFDTIRETIYEASANDPARASFKGTMSTRVKEGGWRIRLTTTIVMKSDAEHFHVTVTRRLTRNGKQVASRTWKEVVARDFQ